MRILTIGLSPYLNISKAKIHAILLEKLFHSVDHEVAGAVWQHDKEYYPPESNSEEKDCFFYKFPAGKVQIFPFFRGKDESIQIYELINHIKPDMVITIGELSDFLYMHAVRSFCTHNFKWSFILANSQNPINEKYLEILTDIDGILCTNELLYDELESKYNKYLELCYVGSNENFYLEETKNPDKIRLMANCKNSQIDNVATIIEAASIVHKLLYNIELYLHINADNKIKDYDLDILKKRFDPNNEFLRFPTNYISCQDGVSEDELRKEYNKADFFISVPMVSSTSLTVFEAISCGCYPILSNTNSNAEVSNFINEEDCLLICPKILAKGENYLYICDADNLADIIKILCKKIEKIKGSRKQRAECIDKFTNDRFLDAVIKMIKSIHKTKDTLFLEN